MEGARIMDDRVTRIALRYEGSRLEFIGDTEIQYAGPLWGDKPKRVGDIEFDYGRWGWLGSLKRVGSREVKYAGSRLTWIGDIELRYDEREDRLKSIGDVELHYENEGSGSRLRWIGDLELGYEGEKGGLRGWLQSRLPYFIVLPDEYSHLSEEKLLLVYFALYLENQRLTQSAAGTI
jgi:hypothetical protein